MVNASLNWASIVGIVLAVCGAGLYFLRSFKPALARDYDVFFAAIGLLCGGILFFQGWRLDPILQFGQFLLAGTTVFFGYESVRLRGVATDQARRSAYFEEDEESSFPPNTGMGGGRWGNSYDQFEETQPIRRRFSSRERSEYDSPEEDLYKPRRESRPAIPEQAASRNSKTNRNSFDQDSVRSRRMARFGRNDDENDKNSSFGSRRNMRQDQRRGSRPSPSMQTNTDSRRKYGQETQKINREVNQSSERRYSGPKGSPIFNKAEDASFSSIGTDSPSSRPRGDRRQSPRGSGRRMSDPDVSQRSRSEYPKTSKPRDNNSRFDD